MAVPVYNRQGETIDEVELRTDIFAAPVNVGLMHQAFERQMANARLGTHQAQTRSEVNRTKSKWYRQKGTGRARHGSRNANLFVGGGVAHGPVAHKYVKDMPKKMQRAAIRSALSVKAGDGQIHLLDELELDVPRTKDIVSLLESLGLEEKVLIVLSERDEIIEKSARNLPHVKTLQANYINIRDLLKYDDIVMPLSALQAIESFLGR